MPRLKNTRNLTCCALQGVKPGSFSKPTEAYAFLHFKLRLKATQGRALWKKVMGEREKGAYTMETYKYTMKTYKHL